MNFQNELKEAIEFHKATKHFHPIMKGWDTLKTKIGRISIGISSQNSRDKRNKIKELKKQMLESRISLDQNGDIAEN